MEPQRAKELVGRLGLNEDPKLGRHFRNLQSYFLLEQGVQKILESPATKRIGFMPEWTWSYRNRNFNVSEEDIEDLEDCVRDATNRDRDER